MFNCFREKPSAPQTIVMKEVELTDLKVVFYFRDGNRAMKEFMSSAGYWPLTVSHEDGVFISEAGRAVDAFMAYWKTNGYTVIGDRIVRFEDFMDAEIQRTTRTVSVRSRSTNE